MFLVVLISLSTIQNIHISTCSNLTYIYHLFHGILFFSHYFLKQTHTGTVNLLNIAGDDFEMLENDQLTIQGMMGSRYLATFEDEVTQWQRELAGVADVMVVLR